MACVRRRHSASPRAIGFGRSKPSAHPQGAGRRSPVARGTPNPAYAALPWQDRNDATQHRLRVGRPPCRAEPIGLAQKKWSGTSVSIDIGLRRSRHVPPDVRGAISGCTHVGDHKTRYAKATGGWDARHGALGPHNGEVLHVSDLRRPHEASGSCLMRTRHSPRARRRRSQQDDRRAAPDPRDQTTAPEPFDSGFGHPATPRESCVEDGHGQRAVFRTAHTGPTLEPDRSLPRLSRRGERPFGRVERQPRIEAPFGPRHDAVKAQSRIEGATLVRIVIVKTRSPLSHSLYELQWILGRTLLATAPTNRRVAQPPATRGDDGKRHLSRER
jgi:hypothetical protein